MTISDACRSMCNRRLPKADGCHRYRNALTARDRHGAFEGGGYVRPGFQAAVHAGRAARKDAAQPHRLRRPHRQHGGRRPADRPACRLLRRARHRRRRHGGGRASAGACRGDPDTRQLPAFRRRRHPAFPESDRGDQGQRRRRHPAALPCRPACRCRQLVPRRLVAVRPAELPRQRRLASHDGGRHRGDDGRLRTGCAALQGGRLRRRRGVGRLSLHARPVLDAVVEPPRRPLGRQPGKIAPA